MRPLLKSIHNLDVRAFSWCLTIPHRLLAVRLARIISYSANGPLYAISGAFFIAEQQWLLVKVLLAGFALERSLYFVFKSTFKRNRPPQAIPGYRSVIEPSDKFSFPSGHTSAAFLVTWAVAIAYPALFPFMLTWACLVGVSRVFLGVHFPTDTLAGSALGSSVCLLMMQIV